MNRLVGPAATVVALLGVVSACGSAEDSETRGRPESTSPPPSAAAYDAATQNEAQALLDDAEDRFVEGGATGKYTGTVELAGAGSGVMVMEVAGRFDYGAVSGQYSVSMPEDFPGEYHLDVRILGREILLNVQTDDGGFGNCWVRSEVPDPDYEENLALAASSMLLEPTALGLVGGSSRDVVAEVFATEAVGAVSPRILNTASGLTEVKVPVVFQLGDDGYRRVTYDAQAALDALVDSGAELDGELEGFSLGAVAIEYSELGAPVAVGRPQERLVADTAAGTPASAPECAGIGGGDVL